MNIIPTITSLNLVKSISESVDTFHHHYHILYDIGHLFSDTINYVEIGCYAGGSVCLMLQRPNTNVFSIDMGKPIAKEIVINNVNKYNIHNNNFRYIKGNSQTPTVVSELKNNLKGNIDILFIDGGHSYNDVITDFNTYKDLVNKGGYIIFDDYNDYQFSPDVKPAVNTIVSNLVGYDIIGTIKNNLGARPMELKEGNCFILKKI